MQSENFDNKIREAADHHHPAYDEKAWEKMEQLLDKHLPQKKDDRRRIIFLILLFILLGSGAWFFLGGRGHSDKTVSTTDKNDQQISVAPTINNDQNISDKNKVSITVQSSDSVNSDHNITKQQKKEENKPVVFDRNKYTENMVNLINDRLKKTVRTNSTSTKNKNSDKNQRSVVNNIPDNVSGAETSSDLSRDNSGNNTVQNSVVPADNNASGKNNSQVITETITKDRSSETMTDKKQERVDKKDITPATAATADTKKQGAKNKKSNYFFLSLSAGPDVSAAGTYSIGKLKPVYGIGLGYSFHDKFSLRTGFYSVRKVYSASADEYHPSYNFWTYYPYLDKVDADCRVFEIPLLLSYNFSHSMQHSIFGSAGVSSYLMKRETYNYISKLPSGQTTNREVTYNNKNKHYFSVFTLSAGYQRNLSRSVSVAAEPYLKIPVNGIGFGKMQLNSAGILFSLQVKPFKDHKKK
jgi:hypothetical protein